MLSNQLDDIIDKLDQYLKQKTNKTLGKESVDLINIFLDRLENDIMMTRDDKISQIESFKKKTGCYNNPKIRKLFTKNGLLERLESMPEKIKQQEEIEEASRVNMKLERVIDALKDGETDISIIEWVVSLTKEISDTIRNSQRLTLDHKKKLIDKIKETLQAIDNRQTKDLATEVSDIKSKVGELFNELRTNDSSKVKSTIHSIIEICNTIQKSKVLTPDHKKKFLDDIKEILHRISPQLTTLISPDTDDKPLLSEARAHLSEAKSAIHRETKYKAVTSEVDKILETLTKYDKSFDTRFGFFTRGGLAEKSVNLINSLLENLKEDNNLTSYQKTKLIASLILKVEGNGLTKGLREEVRNHLKDTVEDLRSTRSELNTLNNIQGLSVSDNKEFYNNLYIIHDRLSKNNHKYSFEALDILNDLGKEMSDIIENTAIPLNAKKLYLKLIDEAFKSVESRVSYYTNTDVPREHSGKLERAISKLFEFASKLSKAKSEIDKLEAESRQVTQGANSTDEQLNRTISDSSKNQSQLTAIAESTQAIPRVGSISELPNIEVVTIDSPERSISPSRNIRR